MSELEKQLKDATDILQSKAEVIDNLGKEWNEYKSALEETKNDERAEVKEMFAKAEQAMEKADELKDQLDAAQLRIDNIAMNAAKSVDGEQVTQEEAEYREAFNLYALKGADAIAKHELKAKEKAFLEAKKMSVDDGQAGGYAVHTQLDNQIVSAARDISAIVQYANVQQTSNTSLTKLFNVLGNDSGWVGERETRSETNTPDFKRTEIQVHTMYARPFITDEIADDASFNVEQFLSEQVSQEMMQRMAAAGVNGDCVKKPLGVATPDITIATDFDDGTWDVNDNWGTWEGIKSGADGLLGSGDKEAIQNLFEINDSLRDKYEANARWFASKQVRTAVRKLMDGENRPYWEPSLKVGVPPVFMGSEFVKLHEMDKLVTDAKAIAFGDMRAAYTFAMRAGSSMKRDDITEPGLIKYTFTLRVGGAPTNYEALKWLQLSA